MKDSDWQILYELYKLPNITKVANLLYISQPSLTKRLKIIEGEFQVQIVNRTPKGIEFTKEGEYLAQKAGEYFEFMNQLKDELQNMKGGSDSLIKLGASYTYGKYVLSEILYKYQNDHAGVRFEVQNELSDILLKKVSSGDLDAAFIRDDFEGEVERGRVSTDQAFILSKEPVTLEQLPGLQRIDYKTNEKTREVFVDWWKQQYGTDAPKGMNAGYVDMAWQYAAKGLGYMICFLPQNYENIYNLARMPVFYPNGKPLVRNTWFIYKKHKYMTAEVKRFVRYIEDNVVIEM